MNLRLLPCLLALASASLFAQPADPRRHDDGRDRRDDRGRHDPRDRRGPARIILYEHADFRGDHFVLLPGDEIGNFDGGTFANGRRLNDRVSSILIEGDAELFVYADSRYRGHVMRVTESIRDLAARATADSRTSWNDRISSVRASRESRRGPDRPVDADAIVRRAYEDVLGRPADPEGLRHFRSLVIDQGWTERMVRDHLRGSAEYRGAGVEKIIARAYQDLLGRDPDPAGLAAYKRQMLERNWSEQELRDAIRQSPEYRNRGR
ncbi:MAG TPA: hypothetical protein VEB66_07235 [Opitutaceae bacterium]|nr:hypothetical protein [Opitutaceae bacterium]